MSIEPLTNDNLKHLTKLVLELWTDCVFEEELGDYKSIIGSEKEVCYLVVGEHEYIGFIHVTIREDYVEGATELPIAYIEGIYVKENYRNRGVAKELVNTAENWAKHRGCKQLASDTEITNSASIDFHKKIGFSEAARIVCFVKNL